MRILDALNAGNIRLVCLSLERYRGHLNLAAVDFCGEGSDQANAFRVGDPDQELPDHGWLFVRSLHLSRPAALRRAVVPKVDALGLAPIVPVVLPQFITELHQPRAQLLAGLLHRLASVRSAG